jgi:hypothetical protein
VRGCVRRLDSKRHVVRTHLSCPERINTAMYGSLAQRKTKASLHANLTFSFSSHDPQTQRP